LRKKDAILRKEARLCGKKEKEITISPTTTTSDIMSDGMQLQAGREPRTKSQRTGSLLGDPPQ
jgi:hypothetical protein